MFESLCTYPLRSDLFTFAIHPTAPVLALGLASGQVQLNCLPDSTSSSSANTSPTFPSDSSPPTSSPSINTITTQWTTRRHKPSCRTLSFTPDDGLHLVSAGTDGLVKLADTSTGQVCSKIALPTSTHKSSPVSDQPTLVHFLNSQTLLLATDSSAIHVYDIRSQSPSSNSKLSGPHVASKPAQTYHPHADYVTSVTSLPSNGAKQDSHTLSDPTQFLSTGGTTVAITDIRRGVLVQSEDQGEELLASALCGDKVVVGGEKGRLRVWQNGVWDDNEVEVDLMPKGMVGVESMSVVPKEEWEEKESKVAVGMDNGHVSFVEVGVGRKGRAARVLEGETVRHDELEGVVGLGFVNGEGRMVTGGGATVKVWEEMGEEEEEEEEKEEEEDYDNESNDEEDDEKAEVVTKNGKKRKGRIHSNASGGQLDESADDDDDDDEDSEEDDETSGRRRKKKRKKGKNKGSAPKSILRFKGLD